MYRAETEDWVLAHVSGYSESITPAEKTRSEQTTRGGISDA